MKRVFLKPSRNESLRRKHPWVFSGAVQRVDDGISDGETVHIYSSDGNWEVSGAWSLHSQIRVRVWSFDQDEEINEEFFRHRLEKAVRMRMQIIDPSVVTAYRLVNAESDGLPGLVADRYGDFIVCQFLSAGAEYWKTTVVRLLNELIPVAGIYERSDTDARSKEGLEPATGPLSGDTPPDLVEILENGLKYFVDVRNGHKTGFYLDQRDNRNIIRDYSPGKEILNCFSYTGGFGIAALSSGAVHVTNIDSSAEQLELARRNFEVNGAHPDKIEYITGDVFQLLRKFRDSRRQFDLIVLDPPKFVASASQLAGGARGYKDINLSALKLLRPGGILFTFSCSGYVGPELFQKIVSDAALDAGREAIILRQMIQSPDHAVSLNFPEGLYLKGLVCIVK